MRGKIRDKRTIQKGTSIRREDGNSQRQPYKRASRSTDWINQFENEEDYDDFEEFEDDFEDDEPAVVELTSGEAYRK